MTSETMKQEIQQLEEQGWKADAKPRAVEKHFRFPDYEATVTFLIALGKATANRTSAMPAIHIESGTEVQVRVGGAPVPTLTEEEIALAKAISSDQ